MTGSSALQLSHDVGYGSLADAWFVDLVHERGLRHVLGARWTTGSSVDELADDALARISYGHNGSEELIVELDGAVAHVIFRERTVTARTAATSRAGAELAVQRLRRRVPAVRREGVELDARFWWWQSHYAEDVARTIHVPAWSEIAGNYSAETATSLADLAEWHHGPPPGGRLIVWHGPSGTGKTHAVRMLAGAWRSWAEFQLISDPEYFLAEPGYLMAVGRDDAGDRGRWRVAVLEDAGESLALDAARHQGQSLSRLLNICDGVLGQAMRMLVLVTTNEPPSRLHPALLRPGRRLAETAFGPLGRHEIERWCVRRDVTPMDRTAATVAELYAHADGREVDNPAGTGRVGFAAQPLGPRT